MKIILSESQFKVLLEQNIEMAAGTPNINPKFMSSDELNNMLIELKKAGYYSYIDQKDIFNYINKLPQGNFMILEFTGTSESGTLDKVKNMVIDTDRLYNKGKGAPRFFLVKEQRPTGKIQGSTLNVQYGPYHGIGIILKLKNEE